MSIICNKVKISLKWWVFRDCILYKKKKNLADKREQVNIPVQLNRESDL